MANHSSISVPGESHGQAVGLQARHDCTHTQHIELSGTVPVRWAKCT